MLFFDHITFREIEFDQSMYIKRAGPQHYLISFLVSSQNCKNLGHGIFLAKIFLMPVEREGKAVSLISSKTRNFLCSLSDTEQTCSVSIYLYIYIYTESGINLLEEGPNAFNEQTKCNVFW